MKYVQQIYSTVILRTWTAKRRRMDVNLFCHGNFGFLLQVLKRLLKNFGQEFSSESFFSCNSNSCCCCCLIFFFPDHLALILLLCTSFFTQEDIFQKKKRKDTAFFCTTFAMCSTYLLRVESHFRVIPNDQPYSITDEIEQAKSSRDVRSFTPLTREGIQHISKFYPPVKNAADLDELPKKLKGTEEFGFSPLFDPALVDECCQRGIFPLTQDIGRGFHIFMPKVHKIRAVCALAASPSERNTISGFPFCEDDEAIFRRSCVGLSRKLLKDPDESTRRPCFEMFINRKEDLADVFTLIRKQHGEDWLCKPLRLCLFHMFFNPEKYGTKIVITAIRRRKYDGETEKPDYEEIIEGELVAGEVGFLVGDVYSSASGAYCINGGGSLQLCLTGLCMHAAGCRVWDLGMVMDYKNTLNCIEMPRMKWLKLVAARRSNPNTSIQKYLQEFECGRSVNYLLQRSPVVQNTNPDSKAQQKKRLKAEARARRKNEKDSADS
ncbi:hypothetical protein ABL78_1349 [Leptomonas seymouri]|uniref:Uncharacterized protein n=1 Tax=Leptomonas seymouri TaxID=5684 RepID=A0A0N1I0U9_LEPSE|nr:hypothetical protein ABL78_1349 [Leptomonas seymouri]|eukprot:KPI89581.1 hypothetical protein ABL78_1349 [Leptomonas seymouri]